MDNMTPRDPNAFSQALAALRPYQRQVLLWTLLTAALSLAPTLYMFQVYDRVVNSRNLTTLGMLTLLVLGVYAVLVLIDGVREDLMQRASRHLDQVLAVPVFDAVFAAHLRQVPVGGDQALSDLRTWREYWASPAALAWMEWPGALLFLCGIFWISPVLALAALAGAVLQVLIAWWTEQHTHTTLVEANRAAMAAKQYARGALAKAQVIESMGMWPGVHARWLRLHRRCLALQAQASDKAGWSSAAARSVQTLQGSVLLGAACWLYLRGQLLEGGLLIIASVLGAKVLQPLVKVVTQWKLLVQAREARQRLQALLSQFPAPATQMPLPAPTGQLAVQGLSVTVPGPEGPVSLLRNVVFALPPGAVMAVIGPSGAGKTTLARALLGLLPSVGDKVRLDGIDPHARDKALLGEHLGYLPQEVALLDGTLAQNVARFGPPDALRLQKACHDAGLDDWIAQLPQGTDTPIGPGGTFLSGGQRQRVGLARAIYGEPALVILDEPCAHLDEAGEAAVLEVVRGLQQRGATTVLVTHQASMLAVADTVMVLRDGLVQALGPRDAVLASLAKAGPASAMTHRPRRPHLETA